MPIATPEASRPASSPSRRAAVAVPAALLGLLVGAVAGYGVGRTTSGLPAALDTNGSYEQGFADARKKAEAAAAFPAAPTSATMLTGRVLSVGDASLDIEVNLQVRNPFEDALGPSRRSVRVGTGTGVFRIAPKPEETVRQERQAALDAAAGDVSKITPVDPYTFTPISLTDIAVGATVIVRSDRDILKEASFEATRIEATP